MHDNSKFSKEEFEPYRRRFYPTSFEVRIDDNDYEFNNAWKHHYMNNPHHPEFWIDHDGMAMDMDDEYIVEMVMDWLAMSRYFNSDMVEWYYSEGKNNNFSDITRSKVEKIVEYIKEYKV